MNTIICTLFEKHYHYGLAALSNSLYQHGFRGSIFAGYRGSLPPWCSEAKDSSNALWPGSQVVDIAENFQICFLPLETDFHLTNYKPFFMLRLWKCFGNEAGAIAYFDPDIVVKCQWSFFETWMSCGVALVHEITANDMPSTHPIRRQWESVIAKSNRTVTRELNSYINGGFCGIMKSHVEFLSLWSEIMDIAIMHYDLKPTKFMPSDRTHIFFATDQDALNIAAMCSRSPISEIGPEGMDLTYGGWTMSHAVGSPKPWRKNFILSALKGNPPSLADKFYWLNVSGPVNCYSSFAVKLKRITMLAASFIGRFYRRS